MWASDLVLLLAAAILLLFMSACSPLYPTNPWADANCYMTVGRGMRAGMVPYRDLMDHKGPLLYAIHMVASLAPGAGGFLGIYFAEILALWLFLIAASRTVALFCEDARLTLPLLIALAALMLSMDTFAYGDSSEEFCLPLMAWSLYDALRCVRDGEEPSAACLLRNGALAGCVLWIKYSILGLHFAWMAFFAIDCIVRKRGFLRAVRMCLAFLAGMALASLPWLIYFGANGALGDLFGIYFVGNLADDRGPDLLRDAGGV